MRFFMLTVGVLLFCGLAENGHADPYEGKARDLKQHLDLFMGSPEGMKWAPFFRQQVLLPLLYELTK